MLGQFIAQGVGPPGDITTFLTLGLAIGAPAAVVSDLWATAATPTGGSAYGAVASTGASLWDDETATPPASSAW